ncbi:hypothetical protein QM012_008345 [Aureobasidium pullulans]|uniref:Uncharacterized protein n=1 Tax=Aureobasidium pullulans TaxID=5580 RepID=A0ABR0TJ57_AURPU
MPRQSQTHLSRPRSKSLGDINSQRNSIFQSAAFEQAQEHIAFSAKRSRSVCGHVHPIPPLQLLEHEETFEHLDNKEEISSIYGEVFGEDIENVFKDANPLMTKEALNGEDVRASDSIWPSSTSWCPSQDQNAAQWPNNFWSAILKTPSADTAPLVPLPSPNDLTSSYLPFSSHLTLTNHPTSSTIHVFQAQHIPVFLHSVLQLPNTLAKILSLHTSDVLCRLTPAILLHHTTTLDAETLLPSLIQATPFSIYHHVNGLLYFPQDQQAVEKVTTFLASTHNTKSEMRTAQTQIQDSEGKRHEVTAWAWIDEVAKGTEEWWTLEDFIAGGIIGLGTVDW